MRLGGPIFDDFDSPAGWVKVVRGDGYSAAYCPVGPDTDEATIRDYRNAAADHDIVIAEVGAWSNPISKDNVRRSEAIDKCKRCLDLADRIGARCCVNLAGTRSEQWDGPDAENYSPATFDLIVSTVQQIIDAVSPERTHYTLEMMPWAPPDTVDSYVRLLEAIGRKHAAVHLDPVNIITNPWAYYHSGQVISECFTKLGPQVKSCHAKDIKLHPKLTVHLDECGPGEGGLDYAAYLRELDRLAPDTPLMLEHLKDKESYARGAAHIRTIAEQTGVTIR